MTQSCVFDWQRLHWHKNLVKIAHFLRADCYQLHICMSHRANFNSWFSVSLLHIYSSVVTAQLVQMRDFIYSFIFFEEEEEEKKWPMPAFSAPFFRCKLKINPSLRVEKQTFFHTPCRHRREQPMTFNGAVLCECGFTLSVCFWDYGLHL